MIKEEFLPKLTEAVLEGDGNAALSLSEEAVAAGLPPLTIIHDGLAPGVLAAGEKFNCGDYFLPHLVMAGEAMKAGLAVLLPHLTPEARAQSSGTVVIGSVEGDVHDIGKNIVSAMLTAAGFQVIDLGINVSAAAFVETAQKEGADIVGLGSYMSTTLPQMPAVIEALKEAGLRDKVKVLVGGAAVSQGYADGIGADAYGVDAPAAMAAAVQLAGGA